MDGSTPDTGIKLGRIVALSGSQVVALLDQSVEARGDGAIPAVQMGALLKMRTSRSIVFGTVTGLSIPLPDHESPERESKLVEIELIGEVTGSTAGERGGFQRGVSVFPALGANLYAASQEDLAQVYAFPARSAVRIGSIHQERSLPAFVVTDDLLGKHFAVLGSTGTGKSCAVALILRAILSSHGQGHVLLLDMHNEYQRAFQGLAEVLNPRTLELPYWLFTFEEIEEVMLSNASHDREAEAGILGDIILAAKRAYLGDTEEARRITVDTPVPYRLSDVARLIDDAAGRLDKSRDPAPYLRLKARLTTLQSDPRFAFMFPGLAVRDNMAAILSRLFRVPVGGKPVTIVDLSAVPSEILNVVVSVLCRMTFDFALWSDRGVPILLVCEEAHRYAPQDGRLGFEPTKRALARIAKEGRKYGVSLCLVSQRPSELEPSILSQCNTIFSLRLTNHQDQAFVRATLSESALGLTDFLPSLRNAEAIAVGEGIAVPMRLCFDELPDSNRPRSGTAPFSTAWSGEAAGTPLINAAIERWRHQRR
jgi:DNA helicase HerA-like ATPase